ncbi:MAG: hypothetical protein IPJ65_25925 [Archangiaceae bacterium]|nr:hypothetical protein [Archangiaceae bacterium]
MSKQGLLVLAILGVLGGGAWLALAPRSIAGAKIVDLFALEVGGPGTVRMVSGEPELSVNEGLDFHVQLDEPAWVYVFRQVGNQASLEYGADAEAQLEKGVWAPDWGDVKGLHFPEGESMVHVLASPQKLTDIHEWTGGDLQTPHVRCPKCTVTSMLVRVARLH